jgi:glycosyltransferase involved in cell wall biosynthesis
MISVIIPAHDEGTVIKRTLTAILSSAEPEELDIVVVCNGCTDETASVARSFGLPVRVIETAVANKANALNLGDQAARGFPRIYLDADVVLTTDAIRELADSLKGDKIVAVAPTGRYDMRGCSWLVRAFFEVRSYLPSAREGIGGSGVYALSEKGRSRFKRFPAVIADDGYVRLQFRPHERKTLPLVFSTVFAPRTLKDLLAQKTRAHYGSYELQRLFPDLWQGRGEGNHKSLIRLFSRPQLWLSLSVYSFVTGLARRQAWKRLTARQVCWERDNSSRSVA